MGWSAFNWGMSDQVRLRLGYGDVATIPRFLSVDDQGLLCIGESGSMEARRRQFVRGMERPGGHSEANLLHHLLQHTRFAKNFPNHRLELRYRREPTKADAKTAEAKLIKQYVRKHGEVPPLNTALPNRHDGW